MAFVNNASVEVKRRRDRAVEDWLREQVVPACDAPKNDPSRAVSVDRVRVTLSTEHRKATTER
jgi:antitoxin ParD1/3/4